MLSDRYLWKPMLSRNANVGPTASRMHPAPHPSPVALERSERPRGPARKRTSSRHRHHRHLSIKPPSSCNTITSRPYTSVVSHNPYSHTLLFASSVYNQWKTGTFFVLQFNHNLYMYERFSNYNWLSNEKWKMKNEKCLPNNAWMYDLDSRPRNYDSKSVSKNTPFIFLTETAVHDEHYRENSREHSKFSVRYCDGHPVSRRDW